MIVLREQAAAKVNLYLHVTGKRADGYHMLDSLVGFADVGDTLAVMPADEVSVTLEGSFAQALSAHDNSILKAAQCLRSKTGVIRGAAFTLTKELPVAAGLGGGSADAAAALRLLIRFWHVKFSRNDLLDLALSLGADVPACLHSASLYMEGIGEKITQGPSLEGIAAVLANPGKSLLTREVFAVYKPPYSSAVRHPREFAFMDTCVDFIRKCRNDLQEPAVKLMPEIGVVLHALERQENCLLARMSGSGPTCFGLFATREQARAAAIALETAHPAWWVRETVLI